MARWNITRRADGHLELAYWRQGTLGVFKAGAIHRLTKTEDVLRWVIEQDATACLDIVTLPDGGALVLLPVAPGEN